MAVLAGLVAALTVSVVFAAGADAQAPAEDSVIGSAVPDLIPPAFGTPVFIDAKSGPAGENPTGRVGITRNCADIYASLCFSHVTEYGGRVTCLNVRGNRAIVGYYGNFTNPDSSQPPDRFRGLIEVVVTTGQQARTTA